MSQKLLTLHEQIVPSSFQINERFRLKKQVCHMENPSEQQNKQQLLQTWVIPGAPILTRLCLRSL